MSSKAHHTHTKKILNKTKKSINELKDPSTKKIYRKGELNRDKITHLSLSLSASCQIGKKN